MDLMIEEYEWLKRALAQGNADHVEIGGHMAAFCVGVLFALVSVPFMLAMLVIIAPFWLLAKFSGFLLVKIFGKDKENV